MRNRFPEDIGSGASDRENFQGRMCAPRGRAGELSAAQSIAPIADEVRQGAANLVDLDGGRAMSRGSNGKWRTITKQR